MTNQEKFWRAFILYLDEHPGAFDKQERTGIKWANAELTRLREAVEWALARETWAHVDHPPSDKEWEYYSDELRRRARVEGK